MKKILLLIVLINIFTYANSKKILIINSYSRDFEWTENQLRGIENYFYGKENIDFFYEYLDNKNIDSEEYLEQYKKIFKEKYKNQTLDLIVTTDDFALSFIRDNYSLLKKVPYVIASGVNHEFPIEENVTILYEKFDIEKNLNLIKRQNSQINTIYFVADSSYSSKGLIEDVKKITDNDKRYEYIWLDEDFFKLKKELTKLKENSAIIHLIYFKDEQGITSKYERTLRELYKDFFDKKYDSEVADKYVEELSKINVDDFNKLKDNKKQIIDDIKNYENSSCHLKNRIETLLNNKNVSRDEVLKNKILNFKNDYKKEFKYLQNIILETSKYPNNYNSESLNCIQNEMKQEVKESSTKKE